VAHQAADLVTFFTGRPSTSLPDWFEPDETLWFIRDNQVAYVFIDRNDRSQRRTAAALQGLSQHGVSCSGLLEYLVCDTRALSLGP